MKDKCLLKVDLHSEPFAQADGKTNRVVFGIEIFLKLILANQHHFVKSFCAQLSFSVILARALPTQ